MANRGNGNGGRFEERWSRDPEMVRGLEGWREWGPEEVREDLARRTAAREIDRRHAWERRARGRHGRWGPPPWERHERPPWESRRGWEEDGARRGYGGYGGGPYGGSYQGMGPGEADVYPPAGVRGGPTGTGSMAGGFGLSPGWKRERIRMRTEGARRFRRWPIEGPLVRDLMTRNPRVVSPDTSVREAARMMREEDAGILPVCEDGRILGVVTDRDLVVRFLAEEGDPDRVPVSEVMSGDVQVAMPDDLLVDAIRVMGEEHVRRLPVVDRDDRIIGILSMTDVAREAEVDYALQDALDRIASRRSFWSRW
ncbi:MAG TPA: CBS domain-containing protein [Fredinandcohnia sp.]|nr:CBS domain-containing protein [Fredinandcohnia sp.]